MPMTGPHIGNFTPEPEKRSLMSRIAPYAKAIIGA